MTFCKERKDKIICDRCNNQVKGNNDSEGNLNVIKRQAPNLFVICFLLITNRMYSLLVSKSFNLPCIDIFVKKEIVEGLNQYKSWRRNMVSISMKSSGIKYQIPFRSDPSFLKLSFLIYHKLK